MRKKKQEGFLAHGDFVYRHDPIPVFVKAKGVYLEDTDGYRYFDAEAANGTVSLGFDSSILEEARKIQKNLPSIPSFCETEIRKKVAGKIGKMMLQITKKKGRIAFELGGAQGMELAIKIVRSNTKKTQLVVFEGGYHGRSAYTSQLSASHRYRKIMGDWRIPIARLPYPDFEQTYPGLSTDEARAIAIKQVERLLSTETAGLAIRSGEQDISALIIEPILNAGGIVMPDKKYLETVVKMFRKAGALIVVDEIFCGFYRTGKMFGFQHYTISPDIVVMSKAITNGIAPLSCVWGRDPYMLPAKFPPGTHSATYINNPGTLAIADVVLDRYQKWETKEKDIKKLERSLHDIIQKIVQSSALVKSGYSIGGIGRILLTENIAGNILDIALTIGRKNPIKGVHGLILASTGMAPNVIALNPPLNINTADVEILRKLLSQTFKVAETKYSVVSESS